MKKLFLVAAFCSMAWTQSLRADFFLRDGDTVVFLGDSITAARGYTKTVELYTLTRFPERKVTFYNAGEGGDTASGAVKRLERDVFSRHPTVVTVAFGINDIGWGTRGDEAHKRAYLDGIRTIVEQCKAHGARPVICSAAAIAQPPDEGEGSFFQKMCDEGLALAKSLGAETVDVQRQMREVQRRILDAEKDEKDPAKRTRLHAPDGIHLNELGDLAMGYALLKGLGAPEDVSRVEIDAARPDAPAVAQGCEVSGLKKLEDGSLEFTRLDGGLPLNFGGFFTLNYRWVPVSDGLNRYLLTIKNLPPGEYEITVEGRSIGKQKTEDLAKGANISTSKASGWEPGGPWDLQSSAVKKLVDARNELAEGTLPRTRLLASNPQAAALGEQARRVDDELVALQRATAKPYPYHFVVRRAVAP